VGVTVDASVLGNTDAISFGNSYSRSIRDSFKVKLKGLLKNWNYQTVILTPPLAGEKSLYKSKRFFGRPSGLPQNDRAGFFNTPQALFSKNLHK